MNGGLVRITRHASVSGAQYYQEHKDEIGLCRLSTIATPGKLDELGVWCR